MIFTFRASHQKYYFKGLLEEGSNRTSPTIKGRSSIPTHTFNFCDTWEENETQTHVTQIYLAPAHMGGDGGVAECCETLRTVSHDMTVWHNQVTAGSSTVFQNYKFNFATENSEQFFVCISFRVCSVDSHFCLRSRPIYLYVVSLLVRFTCLKKC